MGEATTILKLKLKLKLRLRVKVLKVEAEDNLETICPSGSMQWKTLGRSTGEKEGEDGGGGGQR